MYSKADFSASPWLQYLYNLPIPTFYTLVPDDRSVARSAPDGRRSQLEKHLNHLSGPVGKVQISLMSSLCLSEST